MAEKIYYKGTEINDPIMQEALRQEAAAAPRRSAADRAGLSGSAAAPAAGSFDTAGWSEADAATAARYPEFGAGLARLKSDWQAAGTAEQRALINAAANELRKNFGGYTGGADGSGYEKVQPGYSFAWPVTDDRQGFSYGNEDAYQRLLLGLGNRDPFSYDLLSDPQYQQYADQYRTEAERGMKDTLGQLSARTGGLASSYAATAAQQANNTYLQRLNDIIPTLYGQAWDRYAAGQDMDRAAAQMLMADRQDAYGVYQDAQERARQQADAILAAGGTPDPALLQAAGYSGDYAAALAAEAARLRAQEERQRAQEEADRLAGYGDFSGLEREGVDTAYLRALQGAELGKLAGRTSGGTNPGTQPDPDLDAIVNWVKNSYPDGVVTSEDAWNKILAQGYDAAALAAAGITYQPADGGSGMTAPEYWNALNTVLPMLQTGDEALDQEMSRYVESIWPRLNAEQQEGVKQMLAQHGYETE